jgi:CubicO group peptidase (beta-lactamase class C family)
MSGDFQNPKPVSASLPDAQNLKFEREDWTSFRTIEGLQQKAGVSKDKLARLVLKELTDNGLDTGTEVDVGELPKGGYYVQDEGPGIDGTPEEIARLFSIARPMVSTKLLRLPTRGALGNGLRVVAGAVLASEGTDCHYPQSAPPVASRA